jgi:hypothetical protein
MHHKVERRAFLRGGALGIAGAGLTGLFPAWLNQIRPAPSALSLNCRAGRSR